MAPTIGLHAQKPFWHKLASKMTRAPPADVLRPAGCRQHPGRQTSLTHQEHRILLRRWIRWVHLADTLLTKNAIAAAQAVFA